MKFRSLMNITVKQPTAKKLEIDFDTASSQTVVYGVTAGVSAYNFLHGQLAWLKNQGWQVTLVASPDDPAKSAAIREEAEFYSIPMTRTISPIQDLIALWRWLKVLDKISPRAVNVSTPKAGLLGGIAAWIMKIPRRVYVVRGLRLESAKGILRIILWATEWVSMKVATDVLFVSPSLAQKAINLRLLDENKSWVIGSGSSNGVNIQAIEDRIASTSKNQLKLRLNLSHESFIVGFIGRIAHDKGIETLIQCLANPNLDERVNLLCIGSTDDEILAKKLREMGRKVHLFPWTSDIWGHLPVIDVLCLPTLREGFPNVVLEAAAAGIPTITTRATGAIDSVIDEQTGYLIDIGDPAALVHKINILARSEENRTKMGAAAKKRASTEFRQTHIWQGINEILHGNPNSIRAVRVRDSRQNDS